MLRLFFAACDAGTIVALGLLMRRTRRWRLGAILFLGLSPLPLIAWSYMPEDKSLALLLLVLVLAASERACHGAAWAATGALAAVKWMGAFFALPLLVEGFRATSRRIVVPAFAAAAAAVIATLPFFPDSLLGFERRSHRMNFQPGFDSITVVLAKADIYNPILVRLWLPLALLAIAVLHLRHKIDIGEAIALSSAAAFVLLPDESADRILLVTVALILVVRSRWLLWWTVSLVPSVWLFIDYTFGINHPLRHITGSTGSLQHVIGANLLLLAVTAFYLADKVAGRGREPICRRSHALV